MILLLKKSQCTKPPQFFLNHFNFNAMPSSSSMDKKFKLSHPWGYPFPRYCKVLIMSYAASRLWMSCPVISHRSFSLRQSHIICRPIQARASAFSRSTEKVVRTMDSRDRFPRFKSFLHPFQAI